jgi:hypothetical protein
MSQLDAFQQGFAREFAGVTRERKVLKISNGSRVSDHYSRVRIQRGLKQPDVYLERFKVGISWILQSH